MSTVSPSLWEVFGSLPLNQKWKVLGAFASAFVVGYGIGVWYQNFHVLRLELEIEHLRQSTITAPRQQALISFPKDRSYVQRFTDVSGSYSDVNGRAIWVSIYSHRLKRYFPARTEARRTNKTSWTAENIEIGTEEDSNSAEFDIAVFLVEPDSEELSNYLNSQSAEGFVTPFGGMYEQDRVTVFRR